jgi:hypothetical protein
MTSNPSLMIATVVDIEELDEDMSPEGALEYLVEFVFPKETDILLSFFKYIGIEDFDDFMSFNEEDLNQPYSTLSNPDTLLSLSPALIKKLLLCSTGMATCYRMMIMTQSLLSIL